MEEGIPHILPPGSASGNKLQKPSKESAYFSHLATLIFLFFTYRQSQEERTGEERRREWHNVSLNTLLTALHLFGDMIIIGKELTIAFSAIDKLVALF